MFHEDIDWTHKVEQVQYRIIRRYIGGTCDDIFANKGIAAGKPVLIGAYGSFGYIAI